MEITGGCLCRAVRYSISAAPIVTRTCWCRVCQYLGAGNATVNACFPSAALTVSGELRDYCLIAEDRKSTRLNSSHSQISYAVFCLKKKKQSRVRTYTHTS